LPNLLDTTPYLFSLATACYFHTRAGVAEWQTLRT
jgi:hypothetical protein